MGVVGGMRGRCWVWVLICADCFNVGGSGLNASIAGVGAVNSSFDWRNRLRLAMAVGIAEGELLYNNCLVASSTYFTTSIPRC